MKFAVLSDLHLNRVYYKGVRDKQTNLPFRIVDHVRAFQWAVSTCISQEVEKVFITGDIYDTFDPSNEIRRLFHTELRKLQEAQIDTYILTGQHDGCRSHHALEPLKRLKLEHIYVIDTPKIEAVSFSNKKCLLAFFPYSLDLQSGNMKIRSYFKDFSQKIKREIERSQLEGMLFGHFGVLGAIKSKESWTEKTEKTEKTEEDLDKPKRKYVEKLVLNQYTGDVTIGDLESSGCKYVFLGDYHLHQYLPSKKIIATYTGSLEKSHIGEKETVKGFTIYDDSTPEDPETGHTTFVPYADSRSMLLLEGDYFDIKEHVMEIASNTEEKKKYQKCIVKISFVGSKEQMATYNAHAASLWKELKELLDPIYMFNESKVVSFVSNTALDVQDFSLESKEDRIKAFQALESEVKLDKETSKRETLEAIESLVKEKVDHEDDVENILALANDIFSLAHAEMQK